HSPDCIFLQTHEASAKGIVFKLSITAFNISWLRLYIRLLPSLRDETKSWLINNFIWCVKVGCENLKYFSKSHSHNSPSESKSIISNLLESTKIFKMDDNALYHKIIPPEHYIDYHLYRYMYISFCSKAFIEKVRGYLVSIHLRLNTNQTFNYVC